MLSGPIPDNSVGVVLAVHSALVSHSVTTGAVVYDYVMDGDHSRSLSATLVLVSYGIGDLLGRACYEILLTTEEYRKVMAVQTFLHGGVLFLVALTQELLPLIPFSCAFGWLSSTLDVMPVPMLQRFLLPDAVERQLGICRAASGVACLLGPVLVMLFRDGESQSYTGLFLVSGGLSLLAGALWLPGLKKEMDEDGAKLKATTGVPASAADYPRMDNVAADEAGAVEPGAAGAGEGADADGRGEPPAADTAIEPVAEPAQSGAPPV